MANAGGFDAQTEAGLAMSHMLKQIVVPIVDDPDSSWCRRCEAAMK
jgi:hypothetical protein